MCSDLVFRLADDHGHVGDEDAATTLHHDHDTCQRRPSDEAPTPRMPFGEPIHAVSSSIASRVNTGPLMPAFIAVAQYHVSVPNSPRPTATQRRGHRVANAPSGDVNSGADAVDAGRAACDGGNYGSDLGHIDRCFGKINGYSI